MGYKAETLFYLLDYMTLNDIIKRNGLVLAEKELSLPAQSFDRPRESPLNSSQCFISEHLEILL